MQFGNTFLDLGHPRLMGILNVTPDSFSDGGELMISGRPDPDRILKRAAEMVAEGADILDIGGESTRPGAEPVGDSEECDRVLPAVEAILRNLNVIVSVDTSSPQVMREAAELGAGMINDVRALQRPGALEAAAAARLPVCLMHMRGTPAHMQVSPVYTDPVSEVLEFLQERLHACAKAGISASSILIDPGIGFGKSDEHNLAILRRLESFSRIAPVLLGVSRKSLFGRLLGRAVHERLPAGLATGMHALDCGVRILRVHDVAATRDMITMRQLLIERI